MTLLSHHLETLELSETEHRAIIPVSLSKTHAPIFDPYPTHYQFLGTPLPL